MNVTNSTEPAATSQLPKMKIRPSSARITKCPAVMFANNRSVSANGFTIFPMISMGVMMSAIATAPIPVVPDVGDGDVVADEQHDRLDRRAEPRRGLPLAVAPRHLAAAVPDRQEHQRGGDAHEDDVLGG